MAQLSSEYGVHANQIGKWKKQLLELLPNLFTDRRKKKDKDHEELIDELYRQIGQLKVELDWLKKNLRSSCEPEESRSGPGKYGDRHIPEM